VKRKRNKRRSILARAASPAPDVESLLVEAVEQFQNGQLAPASQVLARLLQADPKHGPANQLRGVILHQLGDLPSARDHLERSVLVDGSQAPWYFNLSLTLQTLGENEAAISALRRAILIDADYSSAIFSLASLLLDAGQAVEALELAQRAAQLTPDDPGCWCLLGNCHRAAGNLDGAMGAYQQGLEGSPRDIILLVNLGIVTNDMGRRKRAIAIFEQALIVEPANLEARTQLAELLLAQGRFDSAAAHLAEADKIDSADQRVQLAWLRHDEMTGNDDSLARRVQPLLAADEPNINALTSYAAAAPRLGCISDAADRIEKALHRVGLQSGHQVVLHYALAGLRDKQGKYDAAFRAVRTANELKAQSFDVDSHEQWVQQQLQVYQDGPPYQSSNDDESLVFVVGMPRSGTTLVEQILAAHPQVHPMGERDDIIHMAQNPQVTPVTVDAIADGYLRKIRVLSPDARRLTDKMPSNFLHLGLIATMFPKARIVHCRRDPMDTCLSCYFQNFGRFHAYVTNLQTLGRYYVCYEQLMSHWQEALRSSILDVSYETLVTDPEPTIRELVSFAGLSWDDRCLEPQRVKRDVATASYAQVRQAIHNKSVGRWKNYEQQLAPLRTILDQDRFRQAG